MSAIMTVSTCVSAGGISALAAETADTGATQAAAVEEAAEEIAEEPEQVEPAAEIAAEEVQEAVDEVSTASEEAAVEEVAEDETVEAEVAVEEPASEIAAEEVVQEAADEEPSAVEEAAVEETESSENAEVIEEAEKAADEQATDAESVEEKALEEVASSEAMLEGETDIIDSGNCGDSLTWTLYSDGTLTISGTGEMVGNSWYTHSDTIVNVLIESGVTSIGYNAFNGFPNLKSVSIPESVISIEYNAFEGCSSLTDVMISEGVTSIGEYAFSKCSNLTNITLPESVTDIGRGVFFNCSSLTSVTFPKSVTNFGYSMLSGCSNLTTVVLPDNLTSISSATFSGCSKLSSLTIPNSVRSIQLEAFSGCSSLTDLTIPESVTSIARAAFYQCSSLTSIAIPEGVTTLPTDLFFGCSNLEKVIIPKSLKSIGLMSFSGCNSLSDIYYFGSPENWAAVDIGDENTALKKATIHYEYSLESATISGLIDKDYTGSEITQTPVVTTPLGTVLTEGTDYTVAYSDNINPGTATVTFTGIGDYYGTQTATFQIESISLENATISGLVTKTYTGSAITQALVVTYDGTVLTEGTDYTVAYSDNINPGTATVTITGIGDYSGVKTATFQIIEKPSVEKATITGLTTKTYTGSAITQAPVVTYNGTVLTAGTDYTVGYSNNVNAGTATVTITGKGNYTGTKTATFEINKAAQSITASAAASTIVVGKTTTVSATGAKGTVSFATSNPAIATVDSTGKVTAKAVGTATITATAAATANYNVASKAVTIKILPAATKTFKAANVTGKGIKLTWAQVAGANGYIIYRNNKKIKTITSGSTKTFTDTAANTNGSKYTYKIYAKASTGTSTLYKSVIMYKLTRPSVKSLSNSAAKKITVKWAKNAKAKGYQIQYGLKSNFSGAKTAKVTSYKTVSKVIGSLTKGKTYYVRIRTYKTVSGKTYYSAWSASKKVKISK